EVEVRLVRNIRCVVEAGRGPAIAPFLFDGGRRVAIDLLFHFARHVDLLSGIQKGLPFRLRGQRPLPLGTNALRGTTPIEGIMSAASPRGAGGIRTRDPHTASVMRSHCATAPMLSARARR